MVTRLLTCHFKIIDFVLLAKYLFYFCTQNGVRKVFFMFIKRKKNRSGTVSIVVAGSVPGLQGVLNYRIAKVQLRSMDFWSKLVSD